MKQKLLLVNLLVSLSCTNCSNHPPATVYLTNFEANTFNSQKFTEEDVMNVIGYTLDYLQKDISNDWRINLVNDYIVGFQVTSDDEVIVGFLEGLTDVKEKQITVYVYQPCLAASSLIHELMHALGYMHDDKLAFEVAGHIQSNAIKDLCGKDYKVISPPEPSEAMKQEIGKKIKEILNQSKLDK